MDRKTLHIAVVILVVVSFLAIMYGLVQQSKRDSDRELIIILQDRISAAEARIDRMDDKREADKDLYIAYLSSIQRTLAEGECVDSVKSLLKEIEESP